MSQTNAQLLADSLGTASTGTIPIGGIIIWSGSTGSVPDGWALCNGSNGTPNLQDRFVVGAGSGYAVAATGGSATVTLTTAQMPQHNHGAANVTDKVVRTTGNSEGFPNLGGQFGGATAQLSLNNTVGGGGNTNIGGSQPHENLPPYYALAYIMRTS